MKSIPSKRYRTIDSLRGIAALSVVLFHLSNNLQLQLSELFPKAIMTLFSYGKLGVPVFFVISGFVISLSIKDNQINFAYVKNFIIRRSIRLDPTYWVCILITLLLLQLKISLLGINASQPSYSDILFHMFYLQDIVNITPVISAVYWTLCLEVQFYLYYIFIAYLTQRFFKYLAFNVQQSIILLTGVISLALDYNIIQTTISGLFLPYWHYFLLGILVSNCIKHKKNCTLTLFSWVLLEIVMLINFKISFYALTGLGTVIFIYTFWKKDKLDSILVNSTLQFLGKISYTLYLIHPDIGWKFISLSKHFIPNMSPFIGGVIFVLSILVSIFCAYLLHIIIEKPSLKLCNRFRLKKLPLQSN